MKKISHLSWWKFLWATALTCLICAGAPAQNSNSVAAREAARRQAALPQGVEALARGQAAMAERNYAVAHEEFRAALTYLPDAVVSEKSHDAAASGFCASGLKLAEQRIAEGKYGEAEAICREILSDRYAPNCRPAAEMLAHLQQPGYFNRTMGPKFLAKVEEVKKLLSDAEGYYNSGRYDLAFKKYEQVLNLDPYNVAARRGQEKINLTKTHYGEEAYNETRSRQLWQVQKGWEQPVKKYGQDTVLMSNAVQPFDIKGTARIANKLNTIIIPKIEFRDASIREAVEFLRQQAIANDSGADGRTGVDIVLRGVPSGGAAENVTTTTTTTTTVPGASPPAGESPSSTATPSGPPTQAKPPARPNERITLSLSQIPLGEALRYFAALANMKVKVEPYAVLIIPLSEQSDELITKRYRVPPEFFGGPLDVGYYLSERQSASSDQKQPGQQVTQPLVAEKVLEKNKAFLTTTEGGGDSRTTTTGEGTLITRQQMLNDRQLVGRAGAVEVLQSMGVDFRTPGSSATFMPQPGVLIVRNTQDNLYMVDAIVEEANATRPKQVEIEAKFVEITQSNLKELGFDWLLGQFNAGDRRLFGAGGSSGNGAAVDGANFPFPTNGLSPVTAGNRSGSNAITINAIESLLSGATGGLAPGIFGLAGVFTDPQFQVVIRALNQKKGIDLLSAPRVTTKSGQRAIVQIVREFRYPIRYTPPQIPQTVGAVTSRTDNDIISLGGASTVPVTPTTPTDFTTRNTGVTLEVEPVVSQDGVTIDLNLIPEVTEFEGFINYGSPILAPASSLLNTVTGGLITAPQSVLTPNVINQPIFSSRKVTTSVSVWDGQTVVLGGLMREDVQKTEDKTPFFGDIPIVGRLFRTNVDQHIKRNLVIFVTARLINPGGQLVNSTEEIEETEDFIEPPILPEVPLYKK